jgi:hypothetical protein
MAPAVEEQPVHVHLCDGCGEQFECELVNCDLNDDDDLIICPTCIEEDKVTEEEEEEDYDI